MTATGARRGLLKLEAAWWMSRTLLSNLATWAAVIGWFAADPTLEHGGRLAAIIVSIVALNGAMFVVNDILDADGDAVTAPYLPLPSGLLTLAQAWCVVATGILISVVGLLVAAPSAGRAVAGGLLLALGVVLSAAYSKVKDYGIWGSLTVALPQSVPAVVAWVVAGGGPLGEAFAVLAYLLLASVSNNVLAALRDVEKDPEAGIRTLAVRIGAPGAFRVAAWTGFVALVPVIALAVLRPGWYGLLLVGIGAALHLFCYPRLLANFADPARGRTQRLADQRLWKLGEYIKHGAVVAVFHPVAAVIAVVVLYACLRLGYLAYNNRLVSGALRRSLLGSAPVSARG